MPPAAHKNAMTSHTVPLNGVGCLTVQVGGQPAWRVGDFHICSMQNVTPVGVPVPHVGGSAMKGSLTVLIGSQPAVRQGDMVIEPAAAPPTTPFLPNNSITVGFPTVDIGDVAFGVMAPDVLSRFCEEWRRLRADWPGLTEPERLARTEQMINNALASAGVPPSRLQTPASMTGANGSYSFSSHVINMPASTFSSATAPAGSMAQTLIHEARHAEQYAHTAAFMRGMGFTPAGIHGATGIPQAVAEAVTPAGLGTAAGQHGLMNWRQRWGPGAAGGGYNRAIRGYQQEAFRRHGASSPEYDRALKAYFGLPNENDAESAAVALKNACPAAN